VSRRRGVTLLEVLVATAILSTLGAALLVVLRGGLATWRRSEARRQTYDQAQAILLQLRDDLACALAMKVDGSGRRRQPRLMRRTPDLQPHAAFNRRIGSIGS